MLFCKCHQLQSLNTVSTVVLQLTWEGILAAESQEIPQKHTAQQTSHMRFFGKRKDRKVAASAQARKNSKLHRVEAS